MDPRALEKARSRLRTVNNAIADLEAGGDYSRFTDIWFTFLTAFKSTYTAFEQGAKASPQSRQWFGAKVRERKGDELLQYLYQARNDEEHGLENVAEEVPGRFALEVKIPESGRIDLSRVQIEGNRARLLNGDFAKIWEHTPPSVILAPVRDRDRKQYQPPSNYLSKPLLDTTPLGVARSAAAYLAGMVKEAEGLK